MDKIVKMYIKRLKTRKRTGKDTVDFDWIASQNSDSPYCSEEVAIVLLDHGFIAHHPTNSTLYQIMVK